MYDAPLKLTNTKMACKGLQHLEKAVSRQMVSDVPLGAFLSGLDSSAIAALAKRLDPNMQCFTIDG